MVYTRASSITSGARAETFQQEVRARDRRCVVSKVENYPGAMEWHGFQAAHIFPIAYESQWVANDYGRWITLPPLSGGNINSVQNGILLRSHLHTMWENYVFSINPDNGYKITFFRPDLDNLAGGTLDRRLLDDPKCPPDQLFRWHFRQAVLTNMRDIGEPQHEHDFPPGSDQIGQILAGPKPAERMEFELFTRLDSSFPQTLDS